METFLLSPYEVPTTHEAISQIIQKHSSNPTEIREAVLADLNISQARDVLDLGCGFGFMAEGLAQRIADYIQFTGIDACGENRNVFIEKIASLGHEARFYHLHLTEKLPCLDESMDLIVASYSLYFFRNILPEVARVLRTSGTFLVLAHSRQSLSAFCRSVGIPEEETALVSLADNFSSENGIAFLAPFFEEVKRVDYFNDLVFRRSDFDSFLEYVRFKLPQLIPEAERRGDVFKAISDRIWNTLRKNDELKIRKDDTAFVCRIPKCL